MRGAGIAAGLLLAALAFALGFVPRRVAIGGIVMAALSTLAVAFTVTPHDVDLTYAGCWLSLILAAVSVYWPRPARRLPWLCLAFSLNAGGWAGLVLASEPAAARPPWSLLALLLVIPATLCVERGWSLAPRVVTSWLLAVALLVGAIPHLVVHPGYVRDHME
ncbi:MAG: hypothetical protein ABIT09_05540 [Croceibacterium sp.]